MPNSVSEDWPGRPSRYNIRASSYNMPRNHQQRERKRPRYLIIRYPYLISPITITSSL